MTWASRTASTPLLRLATVGTSAAALLASCSSPLDLPSSIPSSPAGFAQVWSTDLRHGQAVKRLADLQPDPTPARTVVTLDPATRYQTVEGFGASLTDSSVANLMALPADKRDEAMSRLFSREGDGMGLSLLRQPIGSTDFSVGTPFTYADTADPNLTTFDASRQLTSVVPLIQRARELNPALKVMLTPWSAPAWMKTSQNLNGGSLLPQYEDTYAAYVTKSVQAWQAAGIPVSAVTPLNEPGHQGNYPTMTMAADQQVRVVAKIGARFRAAGLTIPILGHDHNWDDTDTPTRLLSDPASQPFVAGTAWHCYGGQPSAQSAVHDRFPDSITLTTECSGGEWSGSAPAAFSGAMYTLQGGINNWSRGVIMWNIALDRNHGPTSGGCTSCHGVLTTDGQTAEPTTTQYALAHMSRWTQPGAQRIRTTTSGPGQLRVTALRNPDATLTAIVTNTGLLATDVSLKQSDTLGTVRLNPGQTITVAY